MKAKASLQFTVQLNSSEYTQICKALQYYLESVDLESTTYRAVSALTSSLIQQRLAESERLTMTAKPVTAKPVTAKPASSGKEKGRERKRGNNPENMLSPTQRAAEARRARREGLTGNTPSGKGNVHDEQWEGTEELFDE